MATPRHTDDGLTARRWLAGLIAQERRLVGLAVACGLLAGVLTFAQLGLLAWLVATLLAPEASAPSALWPAFAGLLAVLPLRALAQWGQEAAGLEASLRVRRRARAELLDHLARLGPVWLAGRHSASLANQLVEQVEALEGYVARFQPQLTLALLLPLACLGIVVWLDWLAALFLLLAAPFIPLFMALVGMGAERLNRDQFAAVARLSGHFIDRVRGITTLQLFGRTRQATSEVHVAADDYRRRSMRTLRLAFLSSAVLEFFASIAIAVLAIYVGFGLLGYITYGPSPALTLFSGLYVLLLAPEFFQPLRALSQHYHDRAAALGAAEGLVALLNETPTAGRGADAGPGSPPAPGMLVSLREATVAHAGRGQVLGPLDLDVVKGEVLVVTGPSGTGKSTLLQLLAGFVGPDSGTCHRAAELSFAWLDQRPLLVHGSLADNLRLASPEADDAMLVRSLAKAGLGELFEALPEGLATPLGERGVGLSGGQAQRLALARIFLSDAPLVLLDEPTASLDTASGANVIEALERLAEEGRALVIATHHPALMAMAHRRLSLEPQTGRAAAYATPRGEHG
ncbi:thiol reductant ABC exporter subunit CydD [Halomonas urumqiensis]|uniref:Thiol reductant ABC exporter subunit CydD n=1 Tax=Halomonas urumqiensis TaxID=1684789 RepID=A0A2N7UPU0_9GAMM|nr:thiol reductant ABC exporter subunit CydD [Halomonas urumqiensis]PMR82459.1 thiol reductant ABC exporter subunit CydD [Halomonas urumqiensis]PTB04060.1 thiol reductant ABC exporter subunit CydD [Halomonas urumqiensis]GHE19679.1 thiol reductant ABC exporter subunit CydD [Halomonas urumqiensis]